VRGALVAALLALAAARSSQAHDLWVVPGKFRLAPGEKTPVFINTGDEFPESSSLLEPERIESFSLHTASGAKPIGGFRADRLSLVAELHAAEGGTAVLALAVRPNLIRLSAPDFNGYLAADGLPQILRLRAERGELGEPVIERYAKWAKAILKVGEERDERWAEPVGLKLELVPERDPASLKPGGELPLKVLFDGAPLPGVIVLGSRAGGEAGRLKGWTDAEGRVALPIPGSGRWALHSIHMVRLEADPQAQWESYWGTLTFEVP
jgi:uncharacterized GH25 family protein